MESMEVISEGEWSSFSGIFTAEEADFMAQLLRNSNIQNEPSGGSGFEVATTSWSSSAVHMDGVETGLLFSSDNNSMYSFSQQGSLSLFSGTLFPNSNHESYYSSDSNHFLGTKNGHMSMDYRMEDDKNTLSHVEPFADSMMELNDCLNWDMSNGSKNLQIKMESEMLAAELSTEDKNNPSESSKRKPRNTGDVSVQKNNRNMKPKKNQKLVAMGNNEEDSSVLHMQSSSGCCMEDDSILNLSPKGSTDLNMNGKTRVSRGSATDPQSIYAKKRREKINERLKILQNLVPNGTKVDISMMLEEAVQYVKFLQLQIKLLSSDDLWMYAPIAYNGMDIGLNLNINNSSH